MASPGLTATLYEQIQSRLNAHSSAFANNDFEAVLRVYAEVSRSTASTDNLAAVTFPHLSTSVGLQSPLDLAGGCVISFLPRKPMTSVHIVRLRLGFCAGSSVSWQLPGHQLGSRTWW
jgi:hypothetical protein